MLETTPILQLDPSRQVLAESPEEVNRSPRRCKDPPAQNWWQNWGLTYQMALLLLFTLGTINAQGDTKNHTTTITCPSNLCHVLEPMPTGISKILRFSFNYFSPPLPHFIFKFYRIKKLSLTFWGEILTSYPAFLCCTGGTEWHKRALKSPSSGQRRIPTEQTLQTTTIRLPPQDCCTTPATWPSYPRCTPCLQGSHVASEISSSSITHRATRRIDIIGSLYTVAGGVISILGRHSALKIQVWP